MNLNIEDLRKNNCGNDYENGYRIVYFYNNSYEVGEYCKSIEGFMIGLAECDPIIDDDDIPKFVSTNDLLNRHLAGLDDVVSVALYDVNGNLVDKIDRENKKMV